MLSLRPAESCWVPSSRSACSTSGSAECSSLCTRSQGWASFLHVPTHHLQAHPSAPWAHAQEPAWGGGLGWGAALGAPMDQLGGSAVKASPKVGGLPSGVTEGMNRIHVSWRSPKRPGDCSSSLSLTTIMWHTTVFWVDWERSRSPLVLSCTPGEA